MARLCPPAHQAGPARRTHVRLALIRQPGTERDRSRRAALGARILLSGAAATLLALALAASTAPSRTRAVPVRLLSARRLEPTLLVLRLQPLSRLPRPQEPAAAEPPGQGIPVLMYHVTEVAPPGTPYPALWVSAKLLERQLRALRARGYHGVTLAAAYDYWHRDLPLPRHPVVLTFDDGYRSNYTNAMPVLRRLGWPGVLFLELADLKKKGADGISPAQVRALAAAGWEIDAHTMTHPDLTTVTPAQLRYEVAGSRRTIQRRFGGPAGFFAYPAGKYDGTVLAAVRRAGYLGAVTELDGEAAADQGMLLKRIRVGGDDSPQTLAEKVAPGASRPGRPPGARARRPRAPPGP